MLGLMKSTFSFSDSQLKSCWSVHLWWRHFARMSDNRPFSMTTSQ